MSAMVGGWKAGRTSPLGAVGQCTCVPVMGINQERMTGYNAVVALVAGEKEGSDHQNVR